MISGYEYFVATTTNGRLETLGRPNVEFGHRISSVNHAVDDGVYAFWRWDGQRLVAGNDRYGFFPLFWSSIDNGIGISPSILQLIELGASTKLDVDALAVFFRLGHFVGEDTPFSEIKTLPPNADFEWENGQLRCQPRYPVIPECSAVSRHNAVDAYIALFEQAMARRLPPGGSSAVPASGGKDSRHILFQLHKMGITPTICVTEKDPPPDPNEDVEVAARLCRELGFPHTIVEHEMSVFNSHVRKVREVGFCEVPDGWYLPVTDFLRQQYNCVYDGIAGDVLSQSSFLNTDLDAVFQSGRSEAICTMLFARHGGTDFILKDLLRGALEPAAEIDVAVARLSREVSRHITAHNPVASFIFWNRTRRKIAMGPYGLLRNVQYVYAPYLDHDLYDFLTTLPASLLMDRRFHTEVIEKAYPAFRNIPYADHKAARTVDDRRVKAQYLAEAGRRLMLKRPSSVVRTFSPRMKMMISILSRGHVNPWLSPLIVYLDQLESVVEEV